MSGGAKLCMRAFKMLATKWVVGNFMPKTKWGKNRLRKRIREVK